MITKVNAVFFSPTGTTKKIAVRIGAKINENLQNDMSLEITDFTLPVARENALSFHQDQLVIFAIPVYAGRVPNILLKYLETIEGNGALAVPLAVFGNRDYDDALIELKDILDNKGLKVIAAGAFIGEHSFSKTLGQNRPDEKDMKIIDDFAQQIYLKIASSDYAKPIEVKGNKPYRYYYIPKNEKGENVDIRKVKPKTNEDCIYCKLCAEVCPMGSILIEDVSKFDGVCIKCGACIKQCPTEAKYYDDEDYLRHKEEIERDFAPRKEPEFFI